MERDKFRDIGTMAVAPIPAAKHGTNEAYRMHLRLNRNMPVRLNRERVPCFWTGYTYVLVLTVSNLCAVPFDFSAVNPKGD